MAKALTKVLRTGQAHRATFNTALNVRPRAVSCLIGP